MSHSPNYASTYSWTTAWKSIFNTTLLKPTFQTNHNPSNTLHNSATKALHILFLHTYENYLSTGLHLVLYFWKMLCKQKFTNKNTTTANLLHFFYFFNTFFGCLYLHAHSGLGLGFAVVQMTQLRAVINHGRWFEIGRFRFKLQFYTIK
jgi:hypothetical protein